MESVIGEFQSHVLQNRTVLIAAVVVISSVLYYIFKNRGLPPGPVGFPVLGLWPLLKNSTCHLTLQKYQKKYGDIFSFNYAGALYLNLGSVKAMREAHITKAECFERTSDFSILTHVFQDGVGFVNGEPWKVLRKFTLNQFKELGMTSIKENMSGPMYDNIKDTIEYLKSKKGEPVEILQLLTDKCNSILRHTMFGYSGITEQEVREMNEYYVNVMSFLTMKNMLHAGNLAKYLIFPLTPGYREAMKNHRKMEKGLYEVVNRHKSNFDEEHPRDYIDAFFKERNTRRSKGDPSAEYFTDKALVATVLQFVGDGVTAVAALATAFLKYAVDHEGEQEKIYSELMDVVGRDREPTIEDKSRLPYTNAFILELLRTFDFFPMFPSQQCIKETTLRGYRIPKGTITLMNTWCCHFNPEVYEEAEKFNPARFIIEEGKQRPELPVTFGIGKRACIGEGFTMAQVFLFFVTIIKNFKLSLPPEGKPISYEMLMSGKIEVCCQQRH